MESFFRFVSYVDYYRNEERVKNVGFLRWKLYNGKHQIELQLKDVPCVQGSYGIKEMYTEKIIGDVVIDKGIGTFKKFFSAMSASGEEYIDILGDRLYLKNVEGFLILLNSSEYLSVPTKLIQGKEKEECYEKNMIHQTMYGKSNLGEASKETKATSENVLIEGIEEKYTEPVFIKKENTEQTIAKTEQVIDKKIKIIEPIYEDKWQQLCKKYPNVHPFPNNKIFLSIKPEDFIILQQGYQKLVHNSFLLHGFYNYGHMILGKLSEEKETPIYVGVPGVYYEQEKRAAQMFGFVGFESAEHPVQQGSYGYYMIEVEI